jgi:hypothetical protein
MISQKVVSPLNMSHLFVEDWIFGYWDGTGVIAHEGNSLKPHTKITHGVHHPKILRVAASSSYILGLGGGLCNWRLFPMRPANERRSKKVTSHRSALSVNPTTRKISIGKPNKIQWRRSKIPNPKLRNVFEIPENSLDCRPMWRAWGSLKARAQPHGKLNVRPCRCEVREGADHAPVLSLVHSLTIFIWTKWGREAHQSRH